MRAIICAFPAPYRGGTNNYLEGNIPNVSVTKMKRQTRTFVSGFVIYPTNRDFSLHPRESRVSWQL